MTPQQHRCPPRHRRNDGPLRQGRHGVSLGGLVMGRNFSKAAAAAAAAIVVVVVVVVVVLVHVLVVAPSALAYSSPAAAVGLKFWSRTCSSLSCCRTAALPTAVALVVFQQRQHPQQQQQQQLLQCQSQQRQSRARALFPTRLFASTKAAASASSAAASSSTRRRKKALNNESDLGTGKVDEDDKKKKKKNRVDNVDNGDNDDVQLQLELQQLATRTSQDETAARTALTLLQQRIATTLLSSPPSVTIVNEVLRCLAYSKRQTQQFSNISIDGTTTAAEEATRILNGMLGKDNSDKKKTKKKSTSTKSKSKLDSVGQVVVLYPLPNLESFLLVMEAWIAQRNIERVQEIFNMALQQQQQQQDQHPDDDDNDQQGTIELYNKLCKAHGVMGNPAAAEAVLQKLVVSLDNSNNKEEDESVLLPRPNYKTWLHVLRAYAAVGPKQNVSHHDTAVIRPVDKIQDWMQQMTQRASREAACHEWMPDFQAYNCLLQALAKERTLTSAKQAESILYSMIQQSQEQSQQQQQQQLKNDKDNNKHMKSMRPDDASFLHVIQAYSNVGSQSSSNDNKKSTSTSTFYDPSTTAIKVEKLLDLQQALNIVPSVRTLNYALAAMVQQHRSHPCQDVKRAARAQRIVDKMKQVQLQQHASNKNDNDTKTTTTTTTVAPPIMLDVQVYKNLLLACALTPAFAEPADKLEAFSIAAKAWNELLQQQQQNDGNSSSGDSSSSIGPRAILDTDSSVYSLFLKATRLLLPANNNNRKRTDVIQAVMTKCKLAGLVSPAVLREFQAAIPNRELQLQIFGVVPLDVTDKDSYASVSLPTDWTRNVVVVSSNKKNTLSSSSSSSSSMEKAKNKRERI